MYSNALAQNNIRAQQQLGFKKSQGLTETSTALSENWAENGDNCKVGEYNLHKCSPGRRQIGPQQKFSSSDRAKVEVKRHVHRVPKMCL